MRCGHRRCHRAAPTNPFPVGWFRIEVRSHKQVGYWWICPRHVKEPLSFDSFRKLTMIESGDPGGGEEPEGTS